MIEPLEPRIAPATLSGRVLKYTDVDGDAVTVTFTKGALTPAHFTFDSAFATSGPQKLRLIDVETADGVDGSNITVSVKKSAGGDGVVSIGYLSAINRDLGVVNIKGHLGRIFAGNNALPAPSVSALKVMSLGVTTESGLEGSSSIGDAGSISIAGDLGHGLFGGAIGTLKIGGSVLDRGIVFVSGLTKAKIGGSVFSDDAGNTDINVQGNLGSLTIGGSLITGYSGGVSGSPQIHVTGSAGRIAIGGDVRGPTGTLPQVSVLVNGTVGSFTVGGSVLGTGDQRAIIRLADQVTTPGTGVGSVLIKGSAMDMLLGVGLNSANAPVRVGSITIGGAFIKSGIALSGTVGGDGKFGTQDDSIASASVLGSLTIKGLAYGTTGSGDTFAINAGNIVRAKIGQRVVPLGGGAQTVNIAPSNDVAIRVLV